MMGQIQTKDQSLFAATELFKKIECLGIIANQHYFVVCLGANLVQESFLNVQSKVQNKKLKKNIPF
jgi:hypothetical protein